MIIRCIPNLIAPFQIPVHVVEGIGLIEVSNGTIRLILYSTNPMIEGEQVAEVCLIGPVVGIPTALRQLAVCTSGECALMADIGAKLHS